MGDITTHFNISAKVRARLAAVRPNEQYPFIELGNWLTDFSQFKDPTAYTGAKLTVWRRGRAAKFGLRVPLIADLVVDFDRYLDRLFGRPEGDERGGQISLYMRNLVLAVTIEKFRRSPLDLDPTEIEQIYNSHFSQYYPHEHLDFPPGEHGRLRGNDSASTRPKHTCGPTPPPGTRQITSYLDDDLEYVSNLLSLVEKNWVQTQAAPSNTLQRHELLARFGHASHAIEDFFFHSNFMELGWNQLALPTPTDPPPASDVPPPAAGQPNDFNPSRLERLYFRRRQNPAFLDDALSTTSSTPASQLFTGFFGANDVNHTLMDAMEVFLGQRTQGNDVAGRIVEHFLGKLDETDPDRQAQNLAEHRRKLDDGSAYTDLAVLSLLPGGLHPRSKRALIEAYDIDKNLGNEFSTGGTHLGVFGMLQQIVSAAKLGEQQSQETSRVLDAAHNVNDQRSHIPGAAGNAIGAAAEDIGSHSLMAKDSVRELPLRAQAVGVATRVAVYVAEQLVLRVQGAGSGDSTGLDWRHLLQHFLAHPLETEGADPAHPWWLAPARETSVTEPNATDSGPTAHVPQHVEASVLAQRAAEPNKRQLEQLYEGLELGLESDWRSTVNWQFTLDSAAWGGIVGGICGGIAAPASVPAEPAGGHDAGKVIAALALGLLAGSAIGYAGVGLTAGLGSLIGHGPGGVVGLLVGLPALGIVAPTFTGIAIGKQLGS